MIVKPLAFLMCLAASPTLADEPDPLQGLTLFLDYCAVCHGLDAKGSGPMADVLVVPPADLTQLSASNGGTFPTFRVVRQIDGRDPMLAHGGEMPLFGELFSFEDAAIKSEAGQPIITAQPIADLVAWLESVQE
jgi:mono/diheme cytochrome c family protein